MAIKKSQFLVGLVSLASALIGKVGQAAETYNTEDLVPMDASLVDQMIKNNSFRLDEDSNSIKIDEKQILRSLQQELQKKLQNKNVDPDSKEIYKKLIENLKPGSFGEENNEYQSMDFNKPG